MKGVSMKTFLRIVFCLAGCLGMAVSALAATGATRITANPDFEQGLSGWHVSGAARVEPDPSEPGRQVVVLGPGAGSIRQRVQADAANHMTVSVLLHAVPAGAAVVTVRFFDRQGRELMSLHSPKDIQAGKRSGSFEDYFRPHPLTGFVEIAIAKGKTPGTVTVEHAELDEEHDDDAALHSTQDIDALMQPIWKGSLVRDEAVLLASDGSGPATGTLMFPPTRILSVTSYDGTIRYREGVDYTVEGRTLTALAGSSISQVEDKELKHGELAWNTIGGKQILVTYEHSGRWTGPVQAYVGGELPRTMRLLRQHRPLRIVAYGDSITYGIGSSHMRQIPPYQPPWVDLFATELRREWADPNIALYNSSQSGAASDWARAMAGRMVATLHPDLVIVAFGQNDFWRITPAEFSANISAVVRTVKASDPKAEFLLVSTTRFDPAYTANPLYWNRVTQYDARLHAMTGRGIELVDMTAISGAVFAAKAPRDCLNDPLHPDDYLSRWYAQSMIAALTPRSGSGGALEKKGVGDDNPAAPQSVDATGAAWYYNWTPRRSKGAIHAAFVPMIWGPQAVDGDLRAAEHSGAHTLLTFNEPDSATEANMTVAQAIALWPRLEATGMRLGSPATTTGSPWIDQFMAEARKKHLRVDFLCLHWYGDITAPDPVGALRKYLQGYWNRYHLPIWLTEFSGADFSFHKRRTTVQDNARFAAAAAAMMDKLPYVERYAWFGTAWTPGSKDYPTSGLYNDTTHALTPVGVAYAAAK
jgi:lysophospholipase L1-like esterase